MKIFKISLKILNINKKFFKSFLLWGVYVLIHFDIYLLLLQNQEKKTHLIFVKQEKKQIIYFY